MIIGSQTHFNSLTITGSNRLSDAAPIGETRIGRHGRK